LTESTAAPRDTFALSADERSVRDTVRDFAQREIAPGAAERDELERYDRQLFERAGELGIAGLPFPEAVGGAGMGTFAWILALRGDRRGRYGDGGQPVGPRPEPAVHLRRRHR